MARTRPPDPGTESQPIDGDSASNCVQSAGRRQCICLLMRSAQSPAHKRAQRRGNNEAGRTKHAPANDQMTSKINPGCARGETKRRSVRIGVTLFREEINPTKNGADPDRRNKLEQGEPMLQH